jgi:hypothetical protein
MPVNTERVGADGSGAADVATYPYLSEGTSWGLNLLNHLRRAVAKTMNRSSS